MKPRSNLVPSLVAKVTALVRSGVSSVRRHARTERLAALVTHFASWRNNWKFPVASGGAATEPPRRLEPTSSPPATSSPSRVVEREAEVFAFVRGALEQKLKRELRPGEAELGFSALGLDSVSLLELAARLEERFDVALADFAAYEHPTPSALASHLVTLLADVGRAPSEPSAPAGPEAPRIMAPPPRSGAGAATSTGLELPYWPRGQRT